jgi:hypothetical protein
MILTCDRDVRAFSAEVNSLFSTACSVLLLGRVENTTFHHRQWPYQTSLHCVKDKMKCEPAIVSGHVSRFEAPFLRKIFFPKFSFTICRTVYLFILNSSAITITPNLRSERTKTRTLPTFASVLCIFGCPILGRLAHLLALPWTTCAILKHSISS